jgi:membrane protease YdiL (CAAX protease family)
MSAHHSNSKGIVAYLLITFAISWSFWCVPLLFGLTIRSPFYSLFLLPGAFSPAIAAVIVRRWITREGFADAGLRLNFRRNRPYYLIAWLLPLLVVAVIVLLAVVMRIGTPDFSLERAMNTLANGRNPLETVPLAVRFPLIGVLQALIVSIIAAPILWGEEFGWLRLKTGSVWSASLAHAATNAIGGGLTILLFMGAPNWVFVGYTGILSWIPLGGLCAWIILTGQLTPEIKRI